MTETARPLFPHVPPELRNEIYRYLSVRNPAVAPSNAGFPLQPKRYECKHTTVQICPVHHGSDGLLSLAKQNFLEAREYETWVRDNATELRIGVVFKGRYGTFIQQDWDKKMETHLRKLTKQHSWLRKIRTYSIHILWDSIDFGTFKSKKGRKMRTVGQIPHGMTKTLVNLLMDEDVKKRYGHVKTTLRLAPHVAIECAKLTPQFGLMDFVSPADALSGLKRQTRQVWEMACRTNEPESLAICRGFESVPTTSKERLLLSAEENVIAWTDTAGNNMVVSKDVEEGKEPTVVIGRCGTEDDAGKFVFRRLVSECLKAR